jgi:hypothetical protein
MKAQTALFLALLTAAAQAGPRNSGSYSMPTDSVDLGGKTTASAAYSIDASIGGVTGIATAAAPAATAKTGYIAQLYEVTGLALNAAPLTIDEGGARQLYAWQTLDDATFLAVPAASVTWSVVSGPLTSISASGLATAGIVCQPEPASVQGAFAGNTSLPLVLTVLNTKNDNLPGYDNDGIDDKWQKDYFGLPPNPIAGPLFDPDGDGQTNFFEFTAGLIPIDPQSRFTLNIVPVPGQPALTDIVFTPRFSDRTYTVTFKTDLDAALWTPLTGATVLDSGQQRTVTDTSATEPTKFYRLEISKP